MPVAVSTLAARYAHAEHLGHPVWTQLVGTDAPLLGCVPRLKMHLPPRLMHLVVRPTAPPPPLRNNKLPPAAQRWQTVDTPCATPSQHACDPARRPPMNARSRRKTPNARRTPKSWPAETGGAQRPRNAATCRCHGLEATAIQKHSFRRRWQAAPRAQRAAYLVKPRQRVRGCKYCGSASARASL